MKVIELEAIKNALLRYLLQDANKLFMHLTVKEREIVGDEDTFRALLEQLDVEGDTQ